MPMSVDMNKTDKPNKKENLLQAIKFTLFSASAGIIQIASYTLFLEVLHWDTWLSYLISLILSVVWNFTFNRKYTFKATNNLPRAMLLVAAYYLVFTPLSTWWTAALTGATPFTGQEATCAQVTKYVVQIGTMLVNFVTEFFYQKLIVFKDNKASDDQKNT